MITIFNETWVSPEAKAIFTTVPSADQFATATKAIDIGGKIKVAPWGENNDFPQQVLKKITTNEIVSSNMLFNVESAYGMGVKPFVRNNDGSISDCQDTHVCDFFEDNDISGFFLEQVSDMMTFFNVFPQIVLSEDRKKIVGLYHLEAAFSRWGSMQKGDLGITKHYYSSAWGSDTKPSIENIEVSSVLSRYNTLADLQRQVESTKESRFVMQVSMPTPGRTYYADAYWHSIFRSGWFDLSCMIPKFKTALLKNNLAVRNIVYISHKYWEGIMKAKGIASTDLEAIKKMKEDELENIKTFLSDANGKGGTLITSKETYASSTGKAIEDKSIVIESVKSELAGGELVQDSEEASNIISYAMGVHPSLNGATPGKNSGSLGGSDKETLFAMKQAMMQPFRDRLVKPLTLIKRFNKWDDRIIFGVPDYNFLPLKTTQKDADK